MTNDFSYFDEQAMTTLLKSENFQSILIEELFQVLNNKEKDIITKRFALNGTKKQTLEEVGQFHSITRERVRQIQKNALSKLARISPKTAMHNIVNLAEVALKESSYFSTEKNLIKAVSEKTGGLLNEPSILKLAFSINPNLALIKKGKSTHKSWYSTDKLSKKNINLTCSLAESLLKEVKTIISSEELIFNVQKLLKDKYKVNLSRTSIQSILTLTTSIKEVETGYGLTHWRSITPRSIKDKALIILGKIKHPLHFREIAKLIVDAQFDSKSLTVQAVHNELIRYEDFVLVGRGIYALKDWGYIEGTVKDVIYDILKKSGPLSKADIVEEVLKRRHVQIGTISLNLQKHTVFKRVGRAVYTINK